MVLISVDAADQTHAANHWLDRSKLGVWFSDRALAAAIVEAKDRLLVIELHCMGSTAAILVTATCDRIAPCVQLLRSAHVHRLRRRKLRHGGPIDSLKNLLWWWIFDATLL